MKHSTNSCTLYKSKKGEFKKLVYTTKVAEQFQRIYGNAHKCKKCRYTSRSMFALMNHLRRHNSPLLPFNCETANLEEFVCEECGFSTQFVVPFNKHIRDHRQQVKIVRQRNGNRKGCSENIGGEKRNCCLYCKCKFRNLAKHLEFKHKDETEVQGFLVLPKGSLERKRKISLIRKKGNFLHLKSSNTIIPVRTPSRGQQRDYRICPGCRGAYAKLSIRKHFPSCLGPGHSTRNLMELSRRISAKVHPSANKALIKVFCRMRDTDDISKKIKWDPLIVSYGNKLMANIDNEDYLSVRSKLRLLGRFLLEMKKRSDDVTNLSSVFAFKFYRYVTPVVNEMAKLNSTKTFNRVVKAGVIKSLLRKVGRHLKSCYEKKGEDEAVTRVEDFLNLFKSPVELESSTHNLTPRPTDIYHHDPGEEIAATGRLEKELRVVLTPLKAINGQVVHAPDDDENDNTRKTETECDLRKITKHTWTDSEKRFVNELFKESFSSLTLPKFVLCKQAVEKYPELKNRTDKQLYAYINNCIQKSKFDSTSGCEETSKQKLARNAWSDAERSLVAELFKESFTNLRLPRFALCERAVFRHPELKNRTAAQLYAYVNNSINKMKRDSSSQQSSYLEKRRSEAISRNRWTDAEKTIVHQFFQESFANLTLPSFILCEQVVRFVPQLQNRTDKQLYAYINNCINKMKRDVI